MQEPNELDTLYMHMYHPKIVFDVSWSFPLYCLKFYYTKQIQVYTPRSLIYTLNLMYVLELSNGYNKYITFDEREKSNIYCINSCNV